MKKEDHVIEPNQVKDEAEAGLDPTQILHSPEWLQFSERVVDCRDLRSLSQTCSFFRELLKLPVEESRWAWKFAQVFPIIFPYLFVGEDDGLERILRCRLVCHAWTDAIDQFLTAPPPTDKEAVNLKSTLAWKYRFHPKETYGIGPHLGELWLKLDEGLRNRFLLEREADDDITRFLKKFGPDHSRNPVLGREVSLESINDPEFSPKIGEFLGRFGHHIWTVSLEASTKQNMQHLSRILAQMPNLRALQFDSQFISYADSQGAGDVMATFEQNPIPELPHLEKLTGDGLPQPLLEKFSIQLKHLQVRKSNSLSPSILRQMTCLKHLEIKWVDDAETLDIFSELRSPLQSISIKIRASHILGGEECSWNVDKFLQNIKHLSSLTELKIITGCAYIEESLHPIPSTIRNEWIRHLSILEVFEHFPGTLSVSLNFLPCLSNLETLLLQTLMSMTSLKRKTPDIITLRSESECNLWDKVPSLQTFIKEFKWEERGIFGCNRHQRVSRSKFTRDQYLRRRHEQNDSEEDEEV